ncbi:hypothetical protein G7024_16175 [Pseudomonas stutzeri]|uniref:Uncharacterized protein n=1 Tax=Stutzerimonas stutzeri TaxID=316 RepID=A0AA40RTV7_STUST|nr:hypothetical protein [Stutzerimonas stutzeri]
MDRAAFLAHPDVAAFITWLISNLPTLPVHLRIRRSTFVPRALDLQLTGIEQVRDQYQWNGNWALVQRQLADLKGNLQQAVRAGDEAATCCASVAILEWGNVPRSTAFLQRLQQEGKLVQYLNDRAQLLSPIGTQRLGDLTKAIFFKFNSGLTKVHALLDPDGSPIYDGRVGAAIAMLYHLYRNSGSAKASANHAMFAWGPGMDGQGSQTIRQIRNPRLLGYLGTPQLLSHQSPHLWAQRQLILSWIIRDVLQRSRLFESDGAGLAARCHALEAGLFTLGYDLRAMLPDGWSVPDPRKRSSSTR